MKDSKLKSLFNKTDTIIAIFIFAIIVLLWNETDNFEEVSELFAQNIQAETFPKILLVTIGLMTLFIPFEHLFLKKSGKDIDSGRKKKVSVTTYVTMIILVGVIASSEFLGAYITIALTCIIIPLFWGEKNLKILLPYIVLFPMAIIFIFNYLLGVYFDPGLLEYFYQ